MKKMLRILSCSCIIMILGVFLIQTYYNNRTSDILPQSVDFKPAHSKDEAVKAVLLSARIGGPYMQLRGEPGEIQTQYVGGVEPHWRIAIQGIIWITIPAAPPSIPEKHDIHPYLVALFNDVTGEV